MYAGVEVAPLSACVAAMAMIRDWIHRCASRLAAATATTRDPLLCGLVDAVQSGWYDQHRGALAPGFDIGPAHRVLDLGCGEGGASLFCARQGGQVIYADADIDKLLSVQARISAIAAASLPLFCDGAQLALADASVDRIIAMEMLEHTEDPQAVLAELARVGRPGALYLLTVPHARAEHLQQGIAPEAFFQAPNHVHIFEEADFLQRVASVGLEIVSSDGTGFYWVFGLLLFWIAEREAGRSLSGPALDKLTPPFPVSMQQWAMLWREVLTSASGRLLKQRLDRLLPKSLVVLARRPQT